MRAIAQAMQVLGNPVALPNGQQNTLDELKKIKNVALVMVSAKVPATGARRGDHVDCYVMALNGKSLDGGRLAFASLLGPNTQDRRVYALCEGALSLDDPDQPMTGVVHGGCQIEADIVTPFMKDGYITLLLDKNHADFQIANEIVYEINRQLNLATGNTQVDNQNVQAINASQIRVRIPDVYAENPVSFAADLLDLPVEDPQTESRVVINPRAGTIVISGDVEIGDVIVSHKNVVVDADDSPAFAAIDLDRTLQGDESSKPKLQTLVDQLNALQVPTADMIEIIKGIERDGKLHGKLIIEQL
jgi:flagellar P-ring protein precursor FlgI